MHQLNTGVSLHTLRIQQLRDKLAHLESQIPDTPSAGTLLDTLIVKLNLKNDAALARALETAPPTISKLRHGKLPICASFLIRAHEESGLPIKDLKALAGI